jgi:hypothetical protein
VEEVMIPLQVAVAAALVALGKVDPIPLIEVVMVD